MIRAPWSDHPSRWHRWVAPLIAAGTALAAAWHPADCRAVRRALGFFQRRHLDAVEDQVYALRHDTVISEDLAAHIFRQRRYMHFGARRQQSAFDRAQPALAHVHQFA